jgi:hypothetical protein
LGYILVIHLLFTAAFVLVVQDSMQSKKEEAGLPLGEAKRRQELSRGAWQEPV